MVHAGVLLFDAGLPVAGGYETACGRVLHGCVALAGDVAVTCRQCDWFLRRNQESSG